MSEFSNHSIESRQSEVKRIYQSFEEALSRAEKKSDYESALLKFLDEIDCVVQKNKTFDPILRLKNIIHLALTPDERRSGGENALYLSNVEIYSELFHVNTDFNESGGEIIRRADSLTESYSRTLLKLEQLIGYPLPSIFPRNIESIRRGGGLGSTSASANSPDNRQMKERRAYLEKRKLSIANSLVFLQDLYFELMTEKRNGSLSEPEEDMLSFVDYWLRYKKTLSNENFRAENHRASKIKNLLMEIFSVEIFNVKDVDAVLKMEGFEASDQIIEQLFPDETFPRNSGLLSTIRSYEKGKIEEKRLEAEKKANPEMTGEEKEHAKMLSYIYDKDRRLFMKEWFGNANESEKKMALLTGYYTLRDARFADASTMKKEFGISIHIESMRQVKTKLEAEINTSVGVDSIDWQKMFNISRTSVLDRVKETHPKIDDEKYLKKAQEILQTFIIKERRSELYFNLAGEFDLTMLSSEAVDDIMRGSFAEVASLLEAFKVDSVLLKNFCEDIDFRKQIIARALEKVIDNLRRTNVPLYRKIMGANKKMGYSTDDEHFEFRKGIQKRRELSILAKTWETDQSPKKIIETYSNIIDTIVGPQDSSGRVLKEIVFFVLTPLITEDSEINYRDNAQICSELGLLTRPRMSGSGEEIIRGDAVGDLYKYRRQQLVDQFQDLDAVLPKNLATLRLKAGIGKRADSFLSGRKDRDSRSTEIKKTVGELAEKLSTFIENNISTDSDITNKMVAVAIYYLNSNISRKEFYDRFGFNVYDLWGLKAKKMLEEKIGIKIVRRKSIKHYLSPESQ